MKKISLFFLIILFLLPLSVDAKISKYVGVGVTRASLRTEGGKSEWGKFVGLGLEYSSDYSVLVAIEAAYATKEATLENKTWPGSSFLPVSYVSVGDIPIDGSYLEISATIGYRLPIFCNRAYVKLFAGPTLSRQLKYLGKIRIHSGIYLNPDEIDKYKFDYLRAESEGAVNTSINSMVGGAISYKALRLEARYSRSYTKRNYMLGLRINDEIESFSILLGYTF